MKKLLLLTALLLLFMFPAFAQEQGDSTAQQGTAGEKDTLFYRTLVRDIETASYTELVEWCRTVGVPENGDSDALKKRLLDHFEVESQPPEKKKGDTFIIRGSDKTRYFNVEQADENYVTISGGVTLEVNEDEKNILHQIQADKLVYNQKKQLMTAEGNVIYTRKVKDKEEKYFGDKLSFDLDDWSGVFFQGISEKTIDMKGNDTKFFYSGDKIFKSGKNVSVMENATITSNGDPETSYYRLKAKKIWLLAPGEWGVRNAVLYVGNIPMFYFPFFFKPGDRFVFRPSVGYHDVKGHFIQTTTYFKGEPSSSGENLSFLAASDAEDRLYEKELNGLYLRRTETLKENPDDESYIKLMADAYYNLGLYGALEGDLNKTDHINETKFYLGFAKTRNIYDYSGYSTPYYEYDDGKLDDYWNKGYFGSSEYPFRYGAELNTGIAFKYFKSTLSFDIYSDPYLLRDFENRSENMNWGKILGMEDDVEDVEDEYTGVRDRLYWLLHTEFDPTFKIFGNYFDLQVTKLDFYMNWKNKNRDITGFKGLDPAADRYIDPSKRTDYCFPESTFYYPENYVLPDLAVKIDGTIFDRTFNSNTARESREQRREKELEEQRAAQEAEESAETEEDKADRKKLAEQLKATVRDPFEEDEKKEEKEKIWGLRAPDDISDVPITLYSDRNFFEHNLGYSITPNFIIDNRLKDADVLVPSDVDFDRTYSVMRTYGEGKLMYRAGVLNTLFTVDDDIIFSGEYRKHANRDESLTDAEWDSLKLQDYNASNYQIENDLMLKTMPLFMFDRISESYLSYSVDTILYRKSFDYIDEKDDPVYVEDTFEWDKDYFKKHEAELMLSYLSDWRQFQTARFKTVMGPLNREFENEDIMRTGPLTSSMFFKMKENDDGYIFYDPLRFTERLEYGYSYLQGIYRQNLQHNYAQDYELEGKISFFDDDLYFKQSYMYNIYEAHHQEAISTLNLWYLNLMYKAEWMRPYEYEDGVGWVQKDDEEFVPSKFVATFNFSKYGKPFWRNRIRYKTDINIGYNMDLQKFTDNALTASFGFHANIYRLFDISFKTTSENNNTYRYSKSKASTVGEEYINPFTDLWKSFSFWDKDKRYESGFKLKSLETKLVHHLGDWDLSYTYKGYPELNSSGQNPKWDWKSEFCILVQWNPIPELKTQVKKSKEDRYTM